jgi:hypothetical protein
MGELHFAWFGEQGLSLISLVTLVCCAVALHVMLVHMRVV